MTKLALCCAAAALSIFSASCAADKRPQLPSDQATKVRQHRTTPAEDMGESGKIKDSSPLPPTSEGSWKF